MEATTYSRRGLPDSRRMLAGGAAFPSARGCPPGWARCWCSFMKQDSSARAFPGGQGHLRRATCCERTPDISGRARLSGISDFYEAIYRKPACLCTFERSSGCQINRAGSRGSARRLAIIVLLAAVCAGNADPVATLPEADRLIPAAIFDEDERRILSHIGAPAQVAMPADHEATEL